MLCRAIYDCQPQYAGITQYDQLTIDEIYGSMACNPLLVILRKFFEKNNEFLKKLVKTLRLFLVD